MVPRRYQRVLEGITRHQMALDGAWTALHGAKTALDGAWYHCLGAVAGALVLVRWCDGVGAVAKW